MFCLQSQMTTAGLKVVSSLARSAQGLCEFPTFTLCVLGNSACFQSSADFIQNQIEKLFQENRQSVNRFGSRPVLSGLVWIRTVCKGYQKTTLPDSYCKCVQLSDKRTLSSVLDVLIVLGIHAFAVLVVGSFYFKFNFFQK